MNASTVVPSTLAAMGGAKGRDVRRAHLERELRAGWRQLTMSPRQRHAASGDPRPFDHWFAQTLDANRAIDADRRQRINTLWAQWRHTFEERHGDARRSKPFASLRRAYRAAIVRTLEARPGGVSRADALRTAQHLLARFGRPLAIRTFERAVRESGDLDPSRPWQDFPLVGDVPWTWSGPSTEDPAGLFRDFDLLPECLAWFVATDAAELLPLSRSVRRRGRPPKITDT
jgi:hypothetical protein